MEGDMVSVGIKPFDFERMSGKHAAEFIAQLDDAIETLDANRLLLEGAVKKWNTDAAVSWLKITHGIYKLQKIKNRYGRF